ncbi:flavin reductase family protein [Streptomyces sp. NPDC001139]
MNGSDGEDVGMTATSFMSVSLEPPLVMVSVRHGSRMNGTLARADTWAVSLLGDQHRSLASCFAAKGRSDDRGLFADTPHRRGFRTGALLIEGALAAVECRTEQRIPAGDHTLVIGRVLATHTTSLTGCPLLYFRGDYRRLT